jgi:hypothetical protein
VAEIQVHGKTRSSRNDRATTKHFSNLFIFQNKIEKEGLPRDTTAGLGAGGPRFESGSPDHLFNAPFPNVRDFKFKRQLSQVATFAPNFDRD